MLFKHISLDLHGDDYPYSLVMPFGFQTRYICNFLERRVRPERFDADGFRGAFIEGWLNPDVPCAIVSESALRIPIGFDLERYKSLASDDFHEFFIGMLCEGLEKCSRQFSIPLAAIVRGIEEFRQGGYKNEWIHKARLFRPTGIHATLSCDLDIERFVLTLRLKREGITIFDRAILETKPDEIVFAGRFKDVILVENMVVVTDKFGDPTFSLSLDSLAKADIY